MVGKQPLHISAEYKLTVHEALLVAFALTATLLLKAGAEKVCEFMVPANQPAGQWAAKGGGPTDADRQAC